MPSTDGSEVKEYLIVNTEDLKIMSDYTRLNFEELLELDCITYKLLFKDAFIHKMKETKEGQDYLEECYILNQTAPERDKLKSKFGERG